MKSLLIFIAAMSFCCSMTAQDYKHLFQEQKELNKITMKARKEKAGKDAKRTAKAMEKEGWKPMPGKLPLEKQYDRMYQHQYELDSTGKLKYIVGSSSVTANSTSAAQIAAAAVAREEIASNMGVSLTSLISERIQTQQISATEASTIHEIADNSKQIFTQNLGQTNTVLEMYRTLANGNVEVQIGIVYSIDEIRNTTRDALKKSMNEKGLQTASLDEKMGWR